MGLWEHDAYGSIVLLRRLQDFMAPMTHRI